MKMLLWAAEDQNVGYVEPDLESSPLGMIDIKPPMWISQFLVGSISQKKRINPL